jgi:hypothetical protein
MATRLAELSGGTVSVDIYPSAVLGSEVQCLEQVQNGSLDMTKVSAAVMGMAGLSDAYLIEKMVDDVVAELVDRYGELPLPAQTLVLVTKLRRRAGAAGLSEVLVMGSKLRVVGPPLPDSLQVRLQRLYPKGNYLAPARVVLIPLPEDHSDHAMVAGVENVIDSLYPAADPTPSDTLTA